MPSSGASRGGVVNNEDPTEPMLPPGLTPPAVRGRARLLLPLTALAKGEDSSGV